jgi:hypothetical protein
MTIVIKQSSTTFHLIFMMVDSTDHITGKTGLSPTVTISKAGSAFASPVGAISEIGSGWYKVAGNATDSASLGPLILHATATGADPVDTVFNVSAALVDDIAAVLPSSAPGTAGGLLRAGTNLATSFTEGVAISNSITNGHGLSITSNGTGSPLNFNIETGYTFQDAMRLMSSAMLAKVSGMSTTTVVFRNVGDTKNRITATVDAAGNRSAITLDAT